MAIELEGLEFKVEGLSGTSNKGLEDLTKALNGLKSALPSKNKISTVVSGLSQISTAFAAMQGQTKSLSRFAAAMSELRKARVNPTLGKNLGSLAKNAQRFAKVSDDAVTKIERLANALRDLKGVGKISLSVPKSAMESGDANGEAQNLGETFVEQTVKARNFFSSIMNGSFRVTDALNLVKKGAIKAGTALVGIPKFFTGEFASGITTAVKKVGELFAGLKRIAMYRLMRTAIKLFTQGLSEGLKNVYAYSQLVGTSFASNMDLIATNALYAKNSLGAMAAPLLNAIAPAVDYVTDKFVELFNVVNMFIARLTGAETATIAKKAATTWGDATEDAAGRGRQAVEELKRTILGFDELNVLQDNKDNGGGSGSGSGGGADVSSMFEQVPIESSISEFADRLREAFEEGDWSRLGTLLGEKFNDIVNDVPWASIGTNIGTGISAAINVVYSGLTAADFVNLGSKFAELFNNALTNFDAETFGRLAVKRFSILADLIIGAITDVNWGLVASKASDYIIGIFKELSTWLQSVNWVALTSSLFDNLVDAVKNVKYAEIASSIAEFFGSALGAVASVGATIISKIWDGVKNAVLSFGTWVKTDVIDPFVKAFSEGDTAALLELGKNLIEGIFNGIINFFGGIGTWIITNIWNPFVNGFKNAFGIHSPASDPTIVGLGTNLIEGVFSGIVSFFGGIVSWITDKVKTPFQNAWKTVFGEGGIVDTAVSIAVGVVEDAKNWVADAWTALDSAGKTLTSTVKTALEKAKTWAADAWVALGSVGKTLTATVSTALEKAKSWVEDAWTAISSAGKTITTTVKAAVEKASTWVSAAWDAVQTTAGSVTRTLFAAVDKATTWVADAWDAAKTGAANITRKLFQVVDKGTTWVSDAWDAVKTGAANITRKLYQVVDKGATWVADAWSAVKTGAANITRNLMQNVKTGSEWVADAWSAVKTGAANITRTLNQNVNKGTTWVADAWSAAKTGIATVTRSLVQNVTQGTWVADAWKATGVIGKTVTRTLTQSVKKGSKFVQAALDAASIVGGTITRTLKQSVIKGSWYSSAVMMVNKGADTISRVLKQSVEKGSTWVDDAFTAATKLAGTIYRTLRVDAEKTGSSTAWKALDDYYANGNHRAIGGAYYGGNWHNIPQYASGGIPTHGSMFVAGEAGAEVVGHINGRTEVLNASQLASAIHAAVLSAMQQANGSQSPMLNVTVRTEDNEVLARAVAKGQRSLDARLNPTAAY